MSVQVGKFYVALTTAGLVPAPVQVIGTVEYHGKRWDGTGYKVKHLVNGTKSVIWSTKRFLMEVA